MTTPEDRLAVLLRDTDVPVRGDGLSLITERIDRRRRRLRWLAPVAVLAAGSAAVATALLVAPSGQDVLAIDPASSPSQSVSPTAPSQSSSPTPVPSPPEAPTSAPSGVVIMPTAGTVMPPTQPDPRQVVRDWLALVGVTASAGPQDCAPCSLVPVMSGDVVLGQADLERTTFNADRNFQDYRVRGVTNDQLTVTTPDADAAVGRSFEVTGTLSQGVDESIRLTLVSADGVVVGQTSAPAGSERPWSATLTIDKGGFVQGWLVAETFSAKDGSPTRLVAVAVRAAGA